MWNADSDEELLTASQEFELNLKTIESYENNNNVISTVSDASTTATNAQLTSCITGLNNRSAMTSESGLIPKIFSNYTFYCPVNIVLKN